MGKEVVVQNNHIFECDENGRGLHCDESLHEASGKKYRKEDYLLIHVLPKYGVNDSQRVVIFEGLHRNGTLAAGLICSEPPLSELRIIMKSVGANPYFQVLFKTENHVDASGEALPIRVSLADDPFPLKFRS